MSEVLIGQSYFLRFDSKLWQAMQPYPPLGSLYAAAHLRARGYEVAFFDAMLATSEAEWEAALEQHQPRYAVLFEDNFNYLSKMCLLRMRQAAFTMIEMARRRGLTVIVCGADASDHYGRYLAKGADFVVIGEGEITLGELLDHLSGRSRTQLEGILGLARRDPAAPDAGSPWRVHPPRPVLRDLDALPFPAWDLVDLDRYRHIWRRHHGYFSMNMVTTRGCPYHCNWCAKPIWGQRYNVRSPENVVAEMKLLEAGYGPDHIWFMDDIMGLKPGWLERFADRVQTEGVRLPFKSLQRVDLLLKDGTTEALRRAGAEQVWVGAESGAQSILDAMEKGTNVEQIHQATAALHAAGIQVGFFLQFGYPGETREEIRQTLQMVRASRPDDIGISVSYPLPGTTFFERVRPQLSRRQNWQDSADLAMLYDGPFATGFYRQLHRVIHKEFRSRQAASALLARLRGKEPVSLGHRTPTPRLLARLVYNLASLPLARLRLELRARQPQETLTPVAPELSPEAAATPSPQPE